MSNGLKEGSLGELGRPILGLPSKIPWSLKLFEDLVKIVSKALKRMLKLELQNPEA